MLLQWWFAASYKFLLACLIAFCTSVSAEAGTGNLNSETKSLDVNRLSNVWLEAQKDYESIPAIMGMVVDDQTVSWSGTFGVSNLQTDIPVSETTQGSICSISKVFTATAVLQLVTQGKLDLADDIQNLLPDYPFTHAFAEKGPVTVSSLLTHTSGLPREVGMGWSGPDFPFPSDTDFKAGLAELSTQNPVNTQVFYSNVGYALLGALIERISGLSYEEYLQQNLFQTMGMKDSAVGIVKKQHGKTHAVGYSARDRFGKRHEVGLYDGGAMHSAMGISTTIADMSNFASWQFAQLDQTTVNNRFPIELMYQNQTVDARGGSRGFGYQVYTDDKGHEWATHGGMCPGFNSFIKLNFSTRRAFAVMSNANKVRALAFVNSLIYIFELAQAIKAPKTGSPDLSQYIGFYHPFPWNSPYFVTSWGDKLAMLYLPAQSIKHNLYFYQHTSGDEFELLHDGKPTGETIKFQRESSGAVKGVMNNGQYHSKKIE